VRNSGAANTSRRLLVQGESVIGSGVTNYFYSMDHLGSVRELTDAQGQMVSRYDYDPYGRRTVFQENLPATVGFTGHFFHVPSGHSLALFRALDTANGRWLSRDPLGEQTGVNLYNYVMNNPLSDVDRFGLECENVITEQTFLRATIDKQEELDESSSKWGPFSPLVAPFAAVATDGAFFGMNDITFRGEKMLGGNLNYYTQGQVWSTYGAPKSFMKAAIYGWKLVVYRSLPAEVDLRMAEQGYDCHRADAAVGEFERAKTMPLPKDLSMRAAPPTLYDRANNATGGFLEWLGDNTGLW
jgi:RHS repeat-associated protein